MIRSSPISRLQRSRSGFALLDVLVALAVGGLAILAMNATTSLLLSSRTKADADEQVIRTVLATSAAFESVVSSLGPLRPARTSLPKLLQGSSDELRVFTRGPAVIGLDEPTELVLRLRPNGDASAALVLDWTDTEGKLHSYDVAGPLFRARFEFGAHLGEGDLRGDWGGMLPPEFVVLDFSTSSVDDEVRVVVRPRVDAAAFCALTPNERCWGGS